jgi:hypothetical protein
MILIYLIWIICLIGNLICAFIPQDFGEHSMFMIGIIYFLKYWYFSIPSTITGFIIKISD